MWWPKRPSTWIGLPAELMLVGTDGRRKPAPMGGHCLPMGPAMVQWGGQSSQCFTCYHMVALNGVAAACRWSVPWSNGVANPPPAAPAITWDHSMGWPLPANGAANAPMG